MKNKILMFLAILFLLLFSVVLNKEGMEIDCKYKYLAPSSGPLPIDWDKSVVDEFITIFNRQNVAFGDNGMKLNKDTVKVFGDMKMFSLEEIKYYIDNKSFPINSYAMNKLKNDNRIELPPSRSIDNISITYTSRMIFTNFIYGKTFTKEDKDRYDKTGELSDEMKIYMGKMPEPSCDSKTTEPAFTQIPTSDYNQLKTICSVIV